MPSVNRKHVSIWLFGCCLMVALMVIVGGLTRLTESGLSMTDWKPITGILPPLGDTAWNDEFARYQQSPEFMKKNYAMELTEFKAIFWLEYIHRALGRITGLVFLLPFLYFLAKRSISMVLSFKLSIIFCLGGVQGIIGWYMVKSGLIDDPRVSPYRLALHLTMAFIIFALLFWQALLLWFGQEKHPEDVPPQLKYMSLIMTILILVQVVAGGFVAGLDAGLTYNTFPLMDGQLIPAHLFTMTPVYVNFFENITTVQFTHRILALIVLIWSIFLWNKARKTSISFLATILLVVIIAQIVIGINTLIYVVPIALASLHQAIALLIFAISLFINYKLYASVRSLGEK